MKISIVIPVFNEEDNIEKNLGEIESYMIQYAGQRAWEVIAVNDGSEDRTAEILGRTAKDKFWLRVVDLGYHYGRGKALRTGIDAASGEVIVTLEADLSYAPYHIERLLLKLEQENADIVIASAYKDGGTAKNVPWRRLWISKIGNKILSYMFGGNVTVLTCMVRAYKSEFIKHLDLYSEDKEIHLEILSKTKVLGGKIVEIPADLHWRESKLAKLHGKRSSLRRSTLKIKKTSSSHLFFALLNKPGIIFWIPGFLLMAISLSIFLTIFISIVLDLDAGMSFYQTIRISMINAPLSWLTMAFSFILGIQFFTLGFLTNQNKNNQEETYRTLNAIYQELKKKENS
jgi:glycosyltransferase involved in cell wall biosynthesis